jgi:prepilin-type N-terminal cleavage/methylation domain-containing protein
MPICHNKVALARRPGVTFIELLIVLSVLSIGFAVALPPIQSVTKRQRINRAALVVAADLHSAFTSAARGRLPVRISIPGDTTGYVITNRVTGDTIVQRHFEDNAVRVSDLEGGAITLDVFPSGVATGSDTVLVQSRTASPRYLKHVSVSRVGFVRVLP